MKGWLLGALLTVLSLPTLAGVQTEVIKYEIDGEPYTGYLAWDDAVEGERPGILVVHEWWGHNDYARKRAEMLAELGYTAFALDMYGSGKLAEHPDDAKKFMQAVVQNMPTAEKRFAFALNLLREQPTVNADEVAAIGYCFGGGMVLHMARAGMDLDGVVSFHGSLGTEQPAQPGQVMAEVLVFNGEADPFVPAEQVDAFQQEMEAAGVDFRLVNYPGVKHSFTNPGADEFGKRFEMPLKYDEAADKDSWSEMQAFFKRIFSE
jgi:dienelactone hydrolase